jgi:putative glutamate/gamma-aminobutyrate antiporter
MFTENTNRKILSTFSLVMINVIAIDSLRTLSMGAEYGFSLVFYYLLAGLFFFIPTALISAELATAWPNTGGVYIWVREAFGERCGFVTIWLQWIYNVVWYPTILAFIGATLAYLFTPQLANNKYYLLTVVLASFWGATWANCLGLKVSSRLATLGTIFGTLLPMVVIITLGAVWLGLHNTVDIPFTVKSFLPDLSNINNLTFLTGLVFGLMGMEMSAVHAGDVRNPQRDYPRALLISALIIWLSLVLSSLAIALVIPTSKLSVLTGLTDAFDAFFNAYHLSWLLPVIVALIILGSFAGMSAWVLGPTRGLWVATQDERIPAIWQKVNKHGMPVAILLAQGVLVTLLSAVFLFMPTVNSSYWVLSALTSQLALIFYIFLFAAAIRLRYKNSKVPGAYRIPGGKIGIWLVAGAGILSCIVTIAVGFLPPNPMSLDKLIGYEAVLVLGIIIFCGLPLLIYRPKNI